MPKRTDSNQKAIVAKFRSMGAKVAVLSDLGRGIPDLVVGIPVGRQLLILLVEVKDGAKIPSARKLTPDEEKFHAEWKGGVCIISSEKEVEELVGLVVGARE